VCGAMSEVDTEKCDQVSDRGAQRVEQPRLERHLGEGGRGRAFEATEFGAV
jgi:hypothetical protein